MNERAETKSLDELREIVAPIADQSGVTHVLLFGSRARGDFKDESDYDFIIDTREGIGLIDIGCFIVDLEAALGRPVDVIDEVMISGVFWDSIRDDVKEIYDNRPRAVLQNSPNDEFF